MGQVIHGLALCAGVGGLELGVRLALGRRHRVVGYVERDAYAASLLATRMADGALDPAPIWDDLVTFDGRRWRGAVDLISAGFPCPSVSVAGLRRGADDERWLWDDVARIIGEVEPAWVYLENVSGILSADGRVRDPVGVALDDAADGPVRDRTVADVLRGLAELGYDAEWTVLSAAEVGAPHLRQRWFCLARHELRARALPDALGDALRQQPEREQRGGRRERAAERGDAEPGELGEALAHADVDGRLPRGPAARGGEGGARGVVAPRGGELATGRSLVGPARSRGQGPDGVQVLAGDARLLAGADALADAPGERERESDDAPQPEPRGREPRQDAGGRGEPVAHADDVGRAGRAGTGREAERGPFGRGRARSHGDELADAEHAGRGLGGAAHDGDGSHAPGDDAHGRDAAVGRGLGGAAHDGDGSHAPGDDGAERAPAERAGLPLWPPGPGDAAGWREYLAADPQIGRA